MCPPVRPSSREVSLRYFVPTAGGQRKSHESDYTVFRLQVAIMDRRRFKRISLLLSSLPMISTMMGVLEHHTSTRLPRPPARCVEHIVKKDYSEVWLVCLALVEQAYFRRLLLMRDGRTLTWTGHFDQYLFGKASLTSESPHHSPASLHPTSHPWNRCPMSGKVWSW